MSKPIEHTLTVNATPHELYEMLLDSEKHTQWTGGGAKIDRQVGGEFSVFDGAISGKTLELDPDKRIVQSWRPGGWEEGQFSTVTFDLEETDGGTKLTLTHTDVPEEHQDSINAGWKENYWDRLDAMVGG